MEYTYKTRQMIRISEEVGEIYDLELACYNNDLKTLSKLIGILGNISEEEAFDEIDNRIEKGETTLDIYKDIFEGINKKGFFTQKIEATTDTPPNNMKKLTEEFYNQLMKAEMEKEAQKQLKSIGSNGRK